MLSSELRLRSLLACFNTKELKDLVKVFIYCIVDEKLFSKFGVHGHAKLFQNSFRGYIGMVLSTVGKSGLQNYVQKYSIVLDTLKQITNETC